MPASLTSSALSGLAVYVLGMNSRTQLVLFAGNEVAFTLLEIVEQQLRLNKIDAALETASKIADATDWSAAMEAIAISQFRAGDQRGALHTANLIPLEINRNGVLMHIAFAHAQSGHVQGAIETADQIKAPLRRDAVLLGVTMIRMKAHDSPGALAAARTMGNELDRERAYREISRIEDADGCTSRPP
jgi:hypothetical protein